MSDQRLPTDEEREQIRRWLLRYFVMFDRGANALSRAAELEGVVLRQHAGLDPVETEWLAAHSASTEITRSLEAEDTRIVELREASTDSILEAAKDNMKKFDHSAPAPASAALLRSIDPEIVSPNDVQSYFEILSVKPLYKQTATLERLISESSSHPDIHDFTRDLLYKLRNSSGYEPRVHSKMQSLLRRVPRPPHPRGRPRTYGNHMFLLLTKEVADCFDIPTGSAGKIVQEVMPKVLVHVRDSKGNTARHAFSLTDSAVKNLLKSIS